MPQLSELKTRLRWKAHFSSNQIVDSLIQAIGTMSEVAFADLFGSFVSQEVFRDIDIAVYLQSPPQSPYGRFQTAMHIGRKLEKSLGHRCEVDVRLLNEAPPRFRYEVMRTGLPLFTRDGQRRMAYEAAVMSQYFDYRPVSKFFTSYYLRGETGMENPERLIAHLQEMDEALADWERYRTTLSLDDLHTDRDKRNMTLHAMFVSIQCAIDLANQLIAQHRLRTPETYREAFELLTEASILPRELSDKLADLAGFRNALVHIYWRLDFQRVYEILQVERETLVQFREIVRNFLQTASKG